MVNVESKYEETKSMLIEKLNNPYNIEVIAEESIALNNCTCDFCGENILNGDMMSEILHRYLGNEGRVETTVYFVDKGCMEKARDRNK